MTATRPIPLDVVGIGADGWAGLAESSREILRSAEVVLGSSRQLDLLPPVSGQTRTAWPSPMMAGLDDLLARHTGDRLAVLASGDPLLSGLGSTLIRRLGPTAVRIHPAVSSVALALAELRWSWDDTTVLSLVGRPLERLITALAPGAQVVVLSSDSGTPAAVANLLRDAGYGPSRLVVLGDLGTDAASRSEQAADSMPLDFRAPPLNIVAIQCAPADPAAALSTAPGLPEQTFVSDGQLTKRDVRASAASRLAPRPGDLLWDLGAGTGTIAIEWLRNHPRNRAHAVEQNAERAERIVLNACRLGVPDLVVHQGPTEQHLDELPDPDAVFIGGGASLALIDHCLRRLRPGGRLVVHAVTLETEGVLTAAFTAHGGELTRLSVEHLEPIGRLHGWRPARPITQWSVTR